MKIATKLMCALVIFFFASGLLLAGGQGEEAPAVGEEEFAPVTLRFGHANEPTEDSVFHLVALKFKELTEEYTDGAVTVEIYPAAQLGSEQEMVRALQLGTVDFSLISMTNLNPFAETLNFFTLPYLFESTEQGRRILDNRWDEINEYSIYQAGVRILTITDAGFRHISNSKKPIRSLEDLQDVKIRVPNNKVLISTFQSWGDNPIPMAWSETFSALQQKVVDGQENPINVLVAMRFYEVQDYVTLSGHIWQTGALIISEKIFDGFPSQIQEAIVRAGRETMEWEREYISQSIERDKETVQEEGMEIHELTDKEEWMRRARTIWDQFYESIGNGDAERGKQIVENIRAAAD